MYRFGSLTPLPDTNLSTPFSERVFNFCLSIPTSAAENGFSCVR